MRTRRYVAILEGEGPGTSRTLLATADPDTVTAVLDIIRERMTAPVKARRIGVVNVPRD